MRSMFLMLALFITAVTAFAVMAATGYFPTRPTGTLPERIEDILSGAMLALVVALALRIWDDA